MFVLGLLTLYFVGKILMTLDSENIDKVCSLSNESLYFSKLESYYSGMNDWYLLSGFESFGQLNFSCSSKFKASSLIFLPNRDQLLNSTFDFIKIMRNVKPASKMKPTIKFFRLKGFNYAGFKYTNLS
jgi:hypothetical protein